MCLPVSYKTELQSNLALADALEEQVFTKERFPLKYGRPNWIIFTVNKFQDNNNIIFPAAFLAV